MCAHLAVVMVGSTTADKDIAEKRIYIRPLVFQDPRIRKVGGFCRPFRVSCYLVHSVALIVQCLQHTSWGHREGYSFSMNRITPSSHSTSMRTLRATRMISVIRPSCWIDREGYGLVHTTDCIRSTGMLSISRNTCFKRRTK